MYWQIVTKLGIVSSFTTRDTMMELADWVTLSGLLSLFVFLPK